MMSYTSFAGLVPSLGFALLVGAIFYARAMGSRRIVASIAAGGLAFQVFHVLEHALQLSFWVLRPGQPPWLSPWATDSAVGLTYICSILKPGQPTTLGVELLHLFGNSIFLVALVALTYVRAERTPALRTALLVQAFHVAEHVVLTSTFVLAGKAIGVSTGFGMLEGSVLVASRVWFHFGINAVATGFALAALRGSLRPANLIRTALTPA